MKAASTASTTSEDVCSSDSPSGFKNFHMTWHFVFSEIKNSEACMWTEEPLFVLLWTEWSGSYLDQKWQEPCNGAEWEAPQPEVRAVCRDRGLPWKVLCHGGESAVWWCFGSVLHYSFDIWWESKSSMGGLTTAESSKAFLISEFGQGK